MTWNLIAHRTELANPGDYILLSAGVEQTLAYNLEGTIIIGDNVCQHRGSRIFAGTHGNAPLKCPYHGFTGERIQKPLFLTAWVGDWLFAGDGSSVLEEQLGELGPVLSGISAKIGRRHSFDTLPMPCSAEVAIENSLEDLHVSSVHPDTFGKLGLCAAPEFKRYGQNSIAAYKLTDERTLKSLGNLAKHFEDAQADSYFHIFLGPHTCLSSVGGFSFSLQHYLGAGNFTMLHSRLYQGKVLPTAPNLGYFFDEAAEFNRRVFAQDAQICAGVRGQGTFLTPAEERIKWFRE